MKNEKTNIILAIFFVFCASCAGWFQSFAVEKAQRDHNCTDNVTVTNVISGGGDNDLDAYQMNVCGTPRRYAWITDPATGRTNVMETTNGRPDSCAMMITSQTENFLRIFYLRDSGGSQCVSRFISQGWRIVNTRVAHNGDTSNGWGEEVTFSH